MSNINEATKKFQEIFEKNTILPLSEDENTALENNSNSSSVKKLISLILMSENYDEFVEKREKTRTSSGKKTEFLGSIKTSHLVVHLLRILLEKGIVDESQLELDTVAHLENKIEEMKKENPAQGEEKRWLSIRRQVIKEFISGKLGPLRPLATAIIDWQIRRNLDKSEEVTKLSERNFTVRDAEELSDEVTDSFRDLCFERIKWYLFEAQI